MKTEISWNFLGLCAACLAAAVGLLVWPQFASVETFAFVLLGWLVSLCLHEYAHARFAFAFGDHTIEERRYLSLDPILYFRGSSLILPLIALVSGGIALPGGAVLIRTDLIRKRWQQSVVALAGPVTTLLCGLIAYGVAQVVGIGEITAMLRDALILLVFFELMAFVLNILPVPGLDGFAAIRPWLPKGLPRLPARFGGIVSLVMLAVVFFYGYRIIYPAIDFIAGVTGMDLSGVSRAFDRFHFWHGN